MILEFKYGWHLVTLSKICDNFNPKGSKRVIPEHVMILSFQYFPSLADYRASGFWENEIKRQSKVRSYGRVTCAKRRN